MIESVDFLLHHPIGGYGSFDSRRVSWIEDHAASDRGIAFNEDGTFRRYKALDV